MKLSPALFRGILIFLAIGLSFGCFIMVCVFSASRCSQTNFNDESMECTKLSKAACLSILKADAKYSTGVKATYTCPWGVGTLGLGYMSLLGSFLFIILTIFGSRSKSLQFHGFRLALGGIMGCLLLGLFSVMLAEIYNGENFPDDVSSVSYEIKYTRVPYNGNIALAFLSFAAIIALTIFEIKMGKVDGAKGSLPQVKPSEKSKNKNTENQPKPDVESQPHS